MQSLLLPYACKASPSQGGCLCNPRGQACLEPEYLTKSTTSLSSGGLGSDGWQALNGGAPQSGTNSRWQVQLLGCLLG